ncbi:MAG TPA: M61 family peptidase [Verrucomicrobiae bacterium]|nr:M61 family peptidase [Verrucomicrobiae bacterium]
MSGNQRWAVIVIVAMGLILALGSAASAEEAPPGPIHLSVDASSAPQKILHIHEEIPVRPGPLSLYYPEWIPGEHMPDGPIIQLAGLKFTGNGARIAWRRDLVEMFTFHLDVPEGVTTLDADFDFLLSAPASGFSAGSSATASLDLLSWNQVLLYPKGWPARELTFVPSLKIPEGWQYGTALPGAKQEGNELTFAPVTLNTLVDSPVIAGKFFRKVLLTPGENPSHEVDIAADSAAALDMRPETQEELHQLVEEAGALFGTRHYRDYHFLLTLSDDVAHFGLEHHESSDDRTWERSLIDDDLLTEFADLLPHEYVHSWNGKYRRPADLATPDYQTPMKDDLLWVYEGLTEYLGSFVLTARSGLLSDQESREALAYIAGEYEHRPGRDWRPLQDTADSAVFLYDSTEDWSNWRRGVDFYDEGQLLWLDVDSTLRQLTNDKKSMNDFCKIFYAGHNGEPALKTYTFEDVVDTLNSLAPYDWAKFLRERLDGVATKTPVEAVEKSGWTLVYDENPNEMEANSDAVRQLADMRISIGLLVGEDGTVDDVIHGAPAYVAGMGPGMKIAAVNGQQFSIPVLREAVTAAKSSTAPIQILVADGARYRTFSVDYHDGLKYPHLVRNEKKPDYLSEILHPLTQAPGSASTVNQ